MIDVKCERCQMSLDTPGGLLFSPPAGSQVVKMHLCVPCFKVTVNWILGWTLYDITDPLDYDKMMDWVKLGMNSLNKVEDIPNV